MKYEKFGIIGKPIIKARADNLRWDSFGMHNDIARIMMTLRSVKWIINNFDIKYNKFLFYIHFVTISGINVTIRLIKKYIFQNSKNLYNIRNYIFNKLK
jgi:hypothetical protein